MKQSIVSSEALQAVLDYLSKQPYDEVFSLIANVMNSVKPYSDKKEIKNEEKNQAGQE